MGENQFAKYAAEFIGTYLLVLTVGCNVLSNANSGFAVLSIASVLMVMIYSLGGVSGGHFNPAVTVAIALVQQMPGGWGEAFGYFASQIIGGLLAGMSYFAMFGDAFNLKPQEGYSWMEAGSIELLYTFMLCFVVLCVACNTKVEGNQFYGLAIGSVVVAGGYAGGGISGGAFNPAVALGVDFASAKMGFGWSLAYLGYELVGASLAAILFKVVRPGEFMHPVGKQVSQLSKLVAEFLGTFFLVLTVGLNVSQGVGAAAISIAASLMVMIYALGNISGAHFNPAVTLSLLLSGRNKVASPSEALWYILVQTLGGVMGGLSAASLTKAVPLAPVSNWGSAFFAEFFFTFILCFVVLAVASTKTPSKDMYGLAIGSCVVVGGFACSGLSGGSLNPAVSVGLDSAYSLKHGHWGNSLVYSAAEALGGCLATGAFILTRPGEYTKEGTAGMKPPSYGTA